MRSAWSIRGGSTRRRAARARGRRRARASRSAERGASRLRTQSCARASRRARRARRHEGVVRVLVLDKAKELEQLVVALVSVAQQHLRALAHRLARHQHQPCSVPAAARRRLASDAWLSASSIGISAISRAFSRRLLGLVLLEEFVQPDGAASPLFASSTFFCCFLTSFVGFFLKPLAPRRALRHRREGAQHLLRPSQLLRRHARRLGPALAPQPRVQPASRAAACSSIAMAMGG